MDRLFILLGVSIALFPGLTQKAVGEDVDPPLVPGVWTFFDYTEEQGWAIVNDKNVTLAINNCERSHRKLRFEFIGVLEPILNKNDGNYWLEAGFGDIMDGVFVHTSMEYYEYMFSFSVEKPDVLTQLDGMVLNICSRKIGSNYPIQECHAFPSKNFSQVIQGLC